MRRILKVYNYLKEATDKLTIDELQKKPGFSAEEIAENLGILRNNASSELNKLVNEGKAIKLIARPVLYLERSSLEKILGRNIDKKIVTVKSISEILPYKKEEKKHLPFDYLIGHDGSLKNQIEQAKAAILYPPNGLHTLIVGQTGVGKTLFAKMMYEYGKKIKKFSEKAPFIVFNCADYYNNSQLLVSQIFGHVKGAFTGADTEKMGLIEKANGGILFLDEVHRLPPEGQEMIFYFMDTGTFNKLGETDHNRISNVFIICATNEDINSHLLKTFIRRIPIVINIPSFQERPISEKIDVTKYLFYKEAIRVKKSICVESDVVKALIGSVTYGNIGQLKSNIQLICAKGFLNCINKDEIIIDFKVLPENIKDGLLVISKKRSEMEEINELIENKITIRPTDEYISSKIKEEFNDPPFNLYKIIEDKMKMLKEEGMDKDYIKEFITTDIKLHIKGFYKKFDYEKNQREKILTIISEDILDFANEIKEYAEKRLKKRYSERFLYAMGLHLSALFKRIENKIGIHSFNAANMIKYKQEEIQTAVEIKNMIEKKYGVTVPDAEIEYIAILLVTIEEEKEDSHVGILVAAHGKNTASSIVDTVVSLLGEKRIDAVDMPLDISPQEILHVVIEKVKKVDTGKGVLLLVDMGSLYKFDTTIEEATGIRVKALDMVSTPTVIEAVRKSYTYNLDLDTIYESLKNFRGYSIESLNADNISDKAIVTICSSGEGAAVKLKELVQDIVYNNTRENINIIPVGIKNLSNQLGEIQGKYKIIATVGMVDPKINAPYISLESLIKGPGEAIIKRAISNNKINMVAKNEGIVVKDLCEDSLNQFLTFLNPHKITNLLFRFCDILEKKLDREFSNSMKIRVIIHVGCALERAIRNDCIKYNESVSKLDDDIVNKVKDSCRLFDDTINVKLTDDEIYFIADMLNENDNNSIQNNTISVLQEK